MKMTKRGFGTTTLALLATGPWTAASVLAKSNYPNRPVKIVVPYPPGGASDMIARMVAEKLQKAWGQPVIVDNKAGASGIIGAHAVARAAADGYTILSHNSVLIQQPAVMEKLPFDPFKDFTPAVLTIKTNNLFAVPIDSPAKTLKEFVEMVKANPGRHNYGSYGIASAAHLHGELFKQQTGIELTHVPFQGSAPMITNLVGGSCQVPLSTFHPQSHAASIPCGYSSSGLPIGLQIAGRRHDDLGVLQVARAYEAMRPALRPWPLQAPAS